MKIVNSIPERDTNGNFGINQFFGKIENYFITGIVEQMYLIRIL